MRADARTVPNLLTGEVELMGEIARYNEVDCRVMAEIIGYLREHH